MSAVPILWPDVESLPEPYSVGSVSPDLCLRFAQRALPLLAAAENTGFFHVANTDSELSNLTDEILAGVEKATGDFSDVVESTNCGYNIEGLSYYGSGDENSMHCDGAGTEELAIVSTSGYGELSLAWRPVFTYAGHQALRAVDQDVPDIREYVDNTAVRGLVLPVLRVRCFPGTVVRINQVDGEIIDRSGQGWILEHGLYHAWGPRVALIFRQYDAENRLRLIYPRSTTRPENVTADAIISA